MRLKSKPWAKGWIEEHSDFIYNNQKSQSNKGEWSKVFNNQNPINLEIGTGKGGWIHQMALKFPNQNFIGLEIQETAVAIAGRTILESGQQPDNLILIYGDGASVETLFDPAEINKIYLNHSDPWPKARHQKRRLTYKTFLKSYQTILKPNGYLEFKTDNRELFDWSVESMTDFGMTYDDNQISYDLHKEIDKNPLNVMTEYEIKWSNKDVSENWICAKMP